jgi:hypothetical protein
MSTEDLMKVRYKVIADYPNSDYTVGAILNTHNYEDRWSGVAEDFCNQFPHLFKKLEWWEERKLEDMPKYVKFIDDFWRYRETEIAEVFNWYKYPLSACIHHSEVPINLLLPATKKEFKEMPV